MRKIALVTLVAFIALTVLPMFTFAQSTPTRDQLLQKLYSRGGQFNTIKGKEFLKNMTDEQLMAYARSLGILDIKYKETVKRTIDPSKINFQQVGTTVPGNALKYSKEIPESIFNQLPPDVQQKLLAGGTKVIPGK